MNSVISIRAGGLGNQMGGQLDDRVDGQLDGQLDGKVFWDRGLQSYVALLQLFDHTGTYPPPVKRFGTRLAEFVTVDALINHLRGVGFGPDAASLDALQELREEVVGSDGGAEIVGIVDDRGIRHLFLLTPSRLPLRLQPTVDHPAYAFAWGDNGPSTMETARVICERTLVRSPTDDIDVFALTLTVEYLAGIQGDFSLDANGLCDWYLADTPLRTQLTPIDLLGLHRDVVRRRSPDLVRSR